MSNPMKEEWYQAGEVNLRRKTVDEWLLIAMNHLADGNYGLAREAIDATRTYNMGRIVGAEFDFTPLSFNEFFASKERYDD